MIIKGSNLSLPAESVWSAEALILQIIAALLGTFGPDLTSGPASGDFLGAGLQTFNYDFESFTFYAPP
eukprot:624082-Hanusia_phi.AAC.5